MTYEDYVCAYRSRLVRFSAVLVGDASLARVQQLPRQQRTAIVLRYYEDLDDDTIAETLGCSRSTVRSKIARALATFRINSESTTRTETT